MGWLHTWTGLIVGWVLYFVFVTGTAGYFYAEIDRWMRPELPLRSEIAPPATAIASAQSHLTSHASGADFWLINLQGGRNNPNLTVSWRGPQTATVLEALDPMSGETIGGKPRDTGGGFLLYRMHYQLHYFSYDTAIRIVGLCAMIMLVAIVSGIITHKQIFRNFFTFRPGKGQRSWLDAHNVLSVGSLPFFIMITYSGLLFFMFQYMPGGLAAVYGSSGRNAYYEELEPRSSDPARSGTLQPLVPLTQLASTAEKAWGAGSVASIFVLWPGDANARVIVYRQDGPSITRSVRMYFDGATGVPAPPENRGAAETTQDVILALHEGVFAGIVLRWCYFLSGLLGVGMVGTGLVLWTVKRRPQHHKAGNSPFGHDLVERLNIGTIAGLPLAIAAYFWANRLIPAGAMGRAEWEVHVLFIAWATAFLHASLRPLMQAWIEQLWLAAVLFTLLPVLNAFTTDRHLGVTLMQGEWALAGCDLTMLAVGVSLALAAIKVQRRSLLLPVAKQSDLQMDGQTAEEKSA